MSEDIELSTAMQRLEFETETLRQTLNHIVHQFAEDANREVLKCLCIVASDYATAVSSLAAAVNSEFVQAGRKAA